jgi:hypothetical protein
MGTAERLLALCRKLATVAGWSREKLVEFLSLSDCAEQGEYWDRWLDTPIWRTAVDTLLAPRLLRLCYASPFIESLPRDFGARIRRRLRRGWISHPNRGNPYATALLLGIPPADPGAAVCPIEFRCVDAAEFLESSPPAVFDAFALSNIGDGAPPGYLRRLQTAMEHAAAPGAVIVSRTFAEPGPSSGKNWAALDRSLLWGGVEVSHIAAGSTGGKPCFIC